MPKVSQDDLWTVLKSRDPNLVKQTYGNTMAALSHGLRGAITATPGNVLYVADYASIEARVVLWLADDDDALEVFRNGEDIYCYMAEEIYGYPCNKNDHPKERGIGKIAVLGLGFQMGASKFVETCAAGGVTIAEDFECDRCGVFSRQHRTVKGHSFTTSNIDPSAVKVVEAYRSKFWRVKEMWADQEATAIEATDDPGHEYSAGKVTWIVEGRFLYCVLPSGRKLAYPDAWVGEQMTSWGEIRQQLCFKGVNSYNHQWGKQITYGGSLVENITQAVARDILAGAMVRCEASKVYTPILTVHDELLAEAKAGTGSVRDFEALVATAPTWAVGLPIAAEGWTGFRYHK